MDEDDEDLEDDEDEERNGPLELLPLDLRSFRSFPFLSGLLWSCHWSLSFQQHSKMMDGGSGERLRSG